MTGRRSNVGHLIKTKAGKIFLKQSSKEKKKMHQHDYQTSYVNGHGLDEAHQVKFIGGPNKKEGMTSNFSELRSSNLEFNQHCCVVQSLVKLAPILFF